MKRFWTIFAVALVALGVTACSEGADEQATPNFEGVSFYASVNMGADSRATLEKDDEGVWNTIWEGNETLIANINWTNKFEFSNTPEEPNKFTCTDPSILDLMVDGPVSANIYNKNAENGPNSAMGADGISIWSTCMLGSGDPVVLEADCAILRYSSDYEVTFTTTATYFPNGGLFGDGTMEGYDVKNFSELTLPAGKDILVPIFHKDLAGSGSLSYAIDGKTCGTISNFSPKNGTIYNLGTLEPKGYTVYVYNDSNWSNIYLYSWEDGVADSYPTGTWPGSAMTKTTVNGVEYYALQLPGSLNGKKIGMIFNNNDGAQTTDIIVPAVNSDLYYLSSGSVVEDPANPIPTQTYKIYAYQYEMTWNPFNIWCWNATNDVNYSGGEWPGTAITKTEEINGYTYYVYEMPATATGQSIKMLFNNGSAQTGDLQAITLDKDVYVRVSVGAVTVLEDPNNPIPDVVPTDYKVYVKNTAKWSKVYIYAWDGLSAGSWPGTQMTTEVISGTTYYVHEFTGYGAVTGAKLIFSNGSGTQTANIENVSLTKDLFYEVKGSGSNYALIADPRQ